MKETKSALVTYEVQEYIATITLDHPPLNVLSDDLLSQMDVVMDEILSIESVRALVVRGLGEKAFVAGADINQFPSLDAKSGKCLVEKGKKIFDKLAEARFPVICAINGLALGAGLELALACDIRIAEEKARLGLPETGLGILPGYAGTQRLARLIGPGKAKELVFTGVAISAIEAYECGLVERVVADGTAYQESLDMASLIAKKGPVAISKAKEAIDQGLEVSLAEGQDIETNAFTELVLTEDMQEGVRAFKEKRHPNFTGK